MASKIVEHSESVERLHRSAIDLINELNEHTEKIFCVASGGLVFAKQGESHTEAGIFDVIKGLSSSTDLAGMLLARVNELAARAGSSVAAEVDHA